MDALMLGPSCFVATQSCLAALLYPCRCSRPQEYLLRFAQWSNMNAMFTKMWKERLTRGTVLLRDRIHRCARFVFIDTRSNSRTHSCTLVNDSRCVNNCQFSLLFFHDQVRQRLSQKQQDAFSICDTQMPYAYVKSCLHLTTNSVRRQKFLNLKQNGILLHALCDLKIEATMRRFVLNAALSIKEACNVLPRHFGDSYAV